MHKPISIKLSMFFCLSFFFSCGTNELKDEILCGEIALFPKAIWEKDFDIDENRIFDDNFIITKDHIVFPISREELCIVKSEDGSYKRLDSPIRINYKTDFTLVGKNLYLFNEKTLEKYDLETLHKESFIPYPNSEESVNVRSIKVLDDDLYLSIPGFPNAYLLKFSTLTETFERIDLPNDRFYNYYDIAFFKNDNDDRNILIIEGGDLTAFNLETKTVAYRKDLQGSITAPTDKGREIAFFDNKGRAFISYTNSNNESAVFDYNTGEDLYSTSGWVEPLNDKYAITYTNFYYPKNIINTVDGSSIKHLQNNLTFFQLQYPLFMFSDKYLFNHKLNSDILVINLETGCNEFFYEHDDTDLYVFDIQESQDFIMIDFDNETISKHKKF